MVEGENGLVGTLPEDNTIRCREGTSANREMEEATEELSHANSVNLYLSKVSSLFECPKKFYWEYIEQLSPKEEPDYLTFGAAIHEAIACGGHPFDLERAVASLALAKLTDDLKILGTFLLRMFKEKYDQLPIKEMLFQEIPLVYDLPGPFYKYWVVKPDRVVRFKNGEVWLLEYKTTSGYGASTASYYHNSMQTLSYFYATQKQVPDAVGTQLIVMTKKGASKKDEERVIIEPIILSENDKRKALNFIQYAHAYAELIWDKQIFFKFMTSCHKPFGGQCEFYPLCFAGDNKAYFNEVKEMVFRRKDPDSHLFNEEV